MQSLRIPAIPKRLLKDTIILKSLVSNRGQKVFLDDEEIKYVRVQNDVKTTIENNRYVKKNGNILFVDIKNSQYSNIDNFVDDSIIIYKGEEYYIETIEYIDDDRGLHHLEITLI